MDEGAEMAKKMSALVVGRIKELGYHRDNADGGARGLYLQVTEAKRGGVSRSWIYRFVSPITGKPRWMGLGPADVISLAKARELAREARQCVVLGGDPIEARRERQAAQRVAQARVVTFGKCAADYIAQHQAGWRNEKHTTQWKSTFEVDTKAINDLPVAAIDTALVLKVLRPLWHEKPVTASRIRGRIERVLAWATVSEYRQGENPARWRGHLAEMLPHKGKIHRVEHHKALPYGKLPGFMVDLRKRDTVAAAALELTVLCATRTNETIGARWSEIDLRSKTWTIPHERMKSARPHRVPLSDRAVEILSKLPRESEWIFPGRMAGKPLANRAMLETLISVTGSNFTVHGARSTFRDWCKEQTNFPREIAELALAHRLTDGTEAGYSRGDALEKRRQLMSAWAKYLASEPAKPGAGAVITPIRGRAS
jgi:integrase